MTYQQLLASGKRILEEAGISKKDPDARLLLEFSCAITRSDLLAHGDKEADEEKQANYFKLLEKRAQRIPLQHLTGEQDFMGMTFQVNENVLIPRQDTEILVEEVMKDLHGGCSILDLCTGSGCILISLLRYSNECHGVGGDQGQHHDLHLQRSRACLRGAGHHFLSARYSNCRAFASTRESGKQRRLILTLLLPYDNPRLLP